MKMEYKHLSHELGHTNKTPNTIAMWTHGRKHEWLARALPYLTLPYPWPGIRVIHNHAIIKCPVLIYIYKIGYSKLKLFDSDHI
jgi:hypothetical protein